MHPVRRTLLVRPMKMTGKAQGRGFLLRRYPVNSRMAILTLYPIGNQ
jgi:hypothetical protein